jgi:RNA polymerase sigma-70 factor (ECF subfamily)
MDENDSIEVLKDIHLFENFFKNHYRFFCSIAYKLLKDRDLSEEIVQDVFVKVWERRETLDVKGSLAAYFTISIKNSCINFLKHQNIVNNFEKSFHPEESEVDNESGTVDLAFKISQAIDELPPRRKQIFLMSREEGLKYYEIAEQLGISIKTVEAQMGLALKQLRERLRDFI